MDNLKMPFLPEETLRTQRVEIYLQDLKDRLKELQLRHKEVIQNSVAIIKEIDEVSSTLLLAQDENEDRTNRIQKLIQEFEMNKEKYFSSEPKSTENQVDMRQILENFEKLNESHVLAESLMLFCKAKESFDKINTYFESRLKVPRLSNIDYKKLNISESIRDKINKLYYKQIESIPTTSTNVTNAYSIKKNYASENIEAESIKENEMKILYKDDELNEASSYYVSCCSSVGSIQRFNTMESVLNMSASKYSNSLTGYEGDNDDSEYDLSVTKKKNNTKLNIVE